MIIDEIIDHSELRLHRCSCSCGDKKVKPLELDIAHRDG